MTFQLALSYNLDYGFLKYGLPADTIDIDLKVRNMKGIHVHKQFHVPTK